MKTSLPIIAICCTIVTATAEGEHRELGLQECPQAVQTTVRDNARAGHIDEVDVINIEGRMIYRAEIDLPRDRDLKIYVDRDGALMMTKEEILPRELPQAVLNAAHALGPVEDVEKESNGQTITYHVEIDRAGQPDLDVVFLADGSISSQTEEVDDD
jgi:hypothetical protein